jgi:hypothetical protein
VRLLAVGTDVAAQVGGVARGYAVPVSITTIFTNESGEQIPAPEPMTVEEMEKILAERDASRPEELPCDNWSPNLPDATPAEPRASEA